MYSTIPFLESSILTTPLVVTSSPENEYNLNWREILLSSRLYASPEGNNIWTDNGNNVSWLTLLWINILNSPGKKHPNWQRPELQYAKT
jgi:hypothetical protein